MVLFGRFWGKWDGRTDKEGERWREEMMAQ